MNSFLVVLFAALACANAGLLATSSAKILQGPSSRTTVVGPDGSSISAVAPGGTVVAEHHSGVVAHAAPVVAHAAYAAPTVVAHHGLAHAHYAAPAVVAHHAAYAAPLAYAGHGVVAHHGAFAYGHHGLYL